MLASYLLHGHEGGFNHGLISAKTSGLFSKMSNYFFKNTFCCFFWPNSSANSSNPPKKEHSPDFIKNMRIIQSEVVFFVFFSLILIFFKSQYFQNPTSGSDAKYTSNLNIYMCLYQSLHFLYLLGVNLFLLTDFAPGGIC